MTSPAESVLSFCGRRVLVTGGGRGIGKAIAKKCLELNAEVIILDKDANTLLEFTKEFPSILGVHVDLSDWNATKKAIESVLPIHHLANNAGISPTVKFLDADEEHMDNVIDVNFKAIVNVAQVVAKGMIASHITDGTIVNMSSIADSFGAPDLAIYSATKAAIASLTKSMAVELAPHGIRVNSIRPGVVNTELIQGLPEEFQKNLFGSALQRMLFHELIEPEQVANAFVFLSSSMSTRITGTSLTIDEGYTIQ